MAAGAVVSASAFQEAEKKQEEEQRHHLPLEFLLTDLGPLSHMASPRHKEAGKCSLEAEHGAPPPPALLVIKKREWLLGPVLSSLRPSPSLPPARPSLEVGPKDSLGKGALVVTLRVPKIVGGRGMWLLGLRAL